MTGKTETQYQHLEPRPGSNYRTLFLKGRRIRAAVVEQAIHGPDPFTPDEFAEEYQVPLARPRRGRHSRRSARCGRGARPGRGTRRCR
jgi:hypothetical protein